MWLAGAVGMTAALGYYAIGLFVCVLAVVVLALLKIIDRTIDKETPKQQGERRKSPECGDGCGRERSHRRLSRAREGRADRHGREKPPRLPQARKARRWGAGRTLGMP